VEEEMIVIFLLGILLYTGFDPLEAMGNGVSHWDDVPRLSGEE
jgi:hypothetical protein